MSWLQTFEGRRFELLAPRAEDVSLSDIARALARISRFLGHTEGARPYSVAEHSIYVAAAVADGMRGEGRDPEEEPRVVLAALLHDAHEAYIGDITSPVKLALAELGAKGALVELQRRVDAAIAERFGLSPESFSDPRIKAADRLLLAAEKRDLMAHDRDDWGPLPDPSSIAGKIECVPEIAARREFDALVRWWWSRSELVEELGAPARPGGSP